MPTISLADFERDALDTLISYARLPCLSPMFDAAWASNGAIDAATELLASWARERRFAKADVTIHRLKGRTPVLVVTVEATASGGATAQSARRKMRSGRAFPVEPARSDFSRIMMAPPGA